MFLPVRGVLAAGRLIAVTGLVLAAAAAAIAERLESITNPRTRDGTWVSDATGRLRPQTVGQLNARISDVERATGVEMAVVVVRSLDGQSIEETAVRLFERWRIGKRGADNGLLFLWAVNNRRVRVEVGYGLEGALPDGKVGAILDAYVIPKFRAGEFDEGVVAGVDAVLRVASNEPVSLPSAATESYESAAWGVGKFVALAAGMLTLAIGSMAGFSRWRRYRRRRCPECSTPMFLLTESDDDEMLEEGQQAEERLGSVDYDVWKCGACSHHFTLRYPKWAPAYASCPQCHHRTKSSNETVVDPPTTSSAGEARVAERCGFCNYEHEYLKILDPIASRSSSDDDTWSSSSSGGSSSSSSSSGGSFGGGRSGGGGASRGY